MGLATRMTRLGAAVASLLLAVAIVTPAHAATSGIASGLPIVLPAASTTASGPAVPVSAGGPVDAQIWPGQEGGQTAVITAVEVPAEQKLPAVVRVPVLAGTTVQWAGEVLGGDPNSDPERSYVLKQGVGGQYAEFTVTKSHRAQVDSLGTPFTVNGDKVSVTVQWVQSVSSALTAISVRIPANVSRVEISPAPVGEPTKNAAGEALYVLNPVKYAPGQKQAIAISYSTKPPSASTASTGPLLIGLGVALAVAVVVLIVVVARQGVSGGDDAEDDDVEDDDAEGDDGPEAEGSEDSEAPDDPDSFDLD